MGKAGNDDQNYENEYPPLRLNDAPNYANRRQDTPAVPTPAVPQIVETQNSEMRFLVQMIQHIKEDFQKQFKEINQKLTPLALPRQAPPMPLPEPYHPHQYQPYRIPLHPHV